MLTLRYATAADNELLAEMGRTLFSHTFAPHNTAPNMEVYLASAFSPEIQAAEIADPTSVFLIAESEGETVGYARLKRGAPAGMVMVGQPLEIVRLYAHKEWIGQGVGATLMQACLEQAAQFGCDRVWLGVWEKNTRAIAFYQKWGFIQIAMQSFAMGDDLQTDWIMARSVSETC